MWTLRFILIALGIAFVAGLYFYTRRHPPKRRTGGDQLRDPAGSALPAREQLEPRLTLLPATDDPEPASRPAMAPSRSRGDLRQAAKSSPVPAVADAKLFSLAVRLPGEGLSAASVTRTLARLGCVPGHGIYRYAPGEGEALYSIANLFEPGVLDPLSPEVRLRGLVFFFLAPPGRETGARFQRMLGAVHECAGQLEGLIEDHAHRPLTAARELEIRLAAAGGRNSI